jgi:hypothetical protein
MVGSPRFIGHDVLILDTRKDSDRSIAAATDLDVPQGTFS